MGINEEKMTDIQTISIDRNIISPLGLCFFFTLVFSFAIGENKSSNQFILGVTLMYFSWLIVYFVFIVPEIKKLIKKRK